jgi:hypothetical protein
MLSIGAGWPIAQKMKFAIARFYLILSSFVIGVKIKNMDIKLEKSQTGIASELYVAGELCRLGYDVTLTFGNTKAIDLLIKKENKILAIQVKGIQTTKSICWNLDKTKIADGPNLFLVLVNLHVDKPEMKPEFFVLTGSEAKNLFTDTSKAREKRTYLDYNKIKRLHIYQDRWTIFGQTELQDEDEIFWKNISAESFLKGYSEDEPIYTDADIKVPNPKYNIWKEKFSLHFPRMHKIN